MRKQEMRKMIGAVILCTLLCAVGVTAAVKNVAASSVAASSRKTGSSSPGKVRNGWRTVRGKKYYYRNGKKLKGLRKIGKWTYAFDSKGVMLTGWQRIHNQIRYFGRKTGRMRVNTTVNGRRINRKGVWKPVIVLDPGHSSVVSGGYEPLGPGSSQTKSRDTSGTQGVATGVPEYRLNLTISLQLRTLLKNRGYKVIMTHADAKKPLSCIERAQKANKAKADAFIRIHANGSSSSAANGAMTICITRSNPYIPSMYAESRRLSDAVLNAYVKATGCRKEYVWETDSMSGNNWSQVPTTIIEMGYMTNPTEDWKMQQAAYQKKMVRGIADGIEDYLLS